MLKHHQGVSQGTSLGIRNDGSIEISTAQGVENFFQGRLRRVAQSIKSSKP